MDFYSDVSNEIKQYFLDITPPIKIEKMIPQYPYPFDDTEIISTKDFKKHEVSFLLDYFITFQMKHIKPLARKVFISSELKNKLSTEPYNQFTSVISTIKDDLKKGADVNGRLSKGADNPKSPDAMLYNWGLYHFHLGIEKESSNSQYYKRTGKLLVVYIPHKKMEAYFVDISENHKDNEIVFARIKYLEIINRNWPELLEPYVLKEVQPDFSLSDEQRLNLRKKGVSSLDTVDGKAVFGLGLGSTSAKTSLEARMRADYIYNLIHIKESFYKDIQQNFIPKQIPEYLNFKMQLDRKKLLFNIVEYRPQAQPRIIENISI